MRSMLPRCTSYVVLAPTNRANGFSADHGVRRPDLWMSITYYKDSDGREERLT